MRLNWSDDEEVPGQFALWQANCQRSMRGKLGQRELRELEAALLALPEKRLIHGSLTDEDGGVCAIACYAKHKGIDVSKFDPEYGSDEVGIAGGMPRLVAWKVVALNDIEIDDYFVTAEGPTMPLWPHERAHYRNQGVRQRMTYTPEERYLKVLSWVQEALKPAQSDAAVDRSVETSSDRPRA